MRLLDRNGCAPPGTPVRVAVDDQLVDIVEAKALEAGVHAFHHVLAREPALVRVRAHVPGDLGRDHILIARRQLAQEATDNLLAGPQTIDIGAIEIEEAVLEGRLEDRSGLVDRECPIGLMAASRLAEIHCAQT